MEETEGPSRPATLENKEENKKDRRQRQSGASTQYGHLNRGCQYTEATTPLAGR